MLLELTRWLQQLDDLFGLFGYLTFRGILSALTALALSLWWGPAVIRRLAQYKGGQPIRSDGPQTHFSKAGTPTMGGALILVTVLASVLLWGDLRNRYVWLVLAVMLRSEEHTSELQSLMRISYAVFCLKKKKN